ncbi:hypothetical protein QUF72_06575 [Desulfobacterales bacterium HSG2]|nr:hypothetical protein [Desulfobacterales bacterium HSG2]
MGNIIIELIKRYGIWAILASSVAGSTVWVAAHYQAKPGDKVSVIWVWLNIQKANHRQNKLQLI